MRIADLLNDEPLEAPTQRSHSWLGGEQGGQNLKPAALEVRPQPASPRSDGSWYPPPDRTARSLQLASARAPRQQFETSRLLECIASVRQQMLEESSRYPDAGVAESSAALLHSIDNFSFSRDVRKQILADIDGYVEFCARLSIPPYPITPPKVALSQSRFVDLPCSNFLRQVSPPVRPQTSEEVERGFYSLRVAGHATSALWEPVESFVGDAKDYRITDEVGFWPPDSRARLPSDGQPLATPTNVVTDRPFSIHLHSIQEFSTSLPFTLGHLRSEAFCRGNAELQYGSDKKVNDTLDRFESIRRRTKLQNVLGEYKALATNVGFAPYPINAVKLAVFALVFLPGPLGHSIRTSLQVQQKSDQYGASGLEFALDNLGILMQVARVPTAQSSAEAEAEAADMLQWRTWRDDVRKILFPIPTGPTFEIPPPGVTTKHESRTRLLQPTPYSHIILPPASPHRENPRIPPNSAKSKAKSLDPEQPKRKRGRPRKIPLDPTAPVSTPRSKPTKRPYVRKHGVRLGRPPGRPALVRPPPSHPTPSPTPPPERPRFVPDVQGVLPESRRPPPLPIIFSSSDMPAEQHSIALHRRRRIGAGTVQMRELIGSGIREPGDEEVVIKMEVVDEEDEEDEEVVKPKNTGRPRGRPSKKRLAEEREELLRREVEAAEGFTRDEGEDSVEEKPKLKRGRPLKRRMMVMDAEDAEAAFASPSPTASGSSLEAVSNYPETTDSEA